MPEYIVIGSNFYDFEAMFDFRRQRAIIHKNTARIEGRSLESIPLQAEWYAPGMVLIHRYWRQVYFLNIREGWNEEDYFQLAERLMKEQGIIRP